MAKLADALQQPLTTTVDLIRHGEPAGGEMYRGTKDDPLSALGWQQMRAATAANTEWDCIVSSPLLRCAEFASELSQQRNIALSIEPQFREICFGVWEGQRPSELKTQDPQQISNFWLNPVANGPLGSEPFDEFSARIQAAWQQLLNANAGKHVLLVCHGGVIRAILTAIMAMPIEHSFRWHVPYAAVTRLRLYSEQGSNGCDTGGAQLPTLVFHAGQL